MNLDHRHLKLDFKSNAPHAEDVFVAHYLNV